MCESSCCLHHCTPECLLLSFKLQTSKFWLQFDPSDLLLMADFLTPHWPAHKFLFFGLHVLKSNVAFFVYIKKLNKCNTTAVIKAGRGVTPGLTWCHPYFYFLFFCCFIPASPPAAPTTCALAHIQYSACAYMQTCTLKLSSKSCGTHSCHVTPFPFFSLFGVMLIVGCQWLCSLLLWDATRGWEGDVSMVTPVAKGGV